MVPKPSSTLSSLLYHIGCWACVDRERRPEGGEDLRPWNPKSQVEAASCRHDAEEGVGAQMSLESSMLSNVSSLFDPQAGQTIREPPAVGKGNWVGAPCVIYDAELAKYFLYYRIRRPRPVRGGEVRIAESDDGIRFTDIWSCKKEELGTTSIERSALVKGHDGVYRLYISYVDPADNRWRTDLMSASEPNGFDVANATSVFTAADIGAEGVKDPWVRYIDDTYYMILSYAPTPQHIDASLRESMHATADVYNTGATKSCTGLATSQDGVAFRWHGSILSPQLVGWDAYAARISCVLLTPGLFIALYDGSASVAENYEERTGIAISTDLVRWHRFSSVGPILTSPHGSGSLRYADILSLDRETRFYYEYAREDGSHEIRMNTLAFRSGLQ